VTVTTARMIACVERELGMRATSYPHMIRKQRMTKAEADDEIAAMTAVLEMLRMTAKDKPASDTPDR